MSPRADLDNDTPPRSSSLAPVGGKLAPSSTLILDNLYSLGYPMSRQAATIALYKCVCYNIILMARTLGGFNRSPIMLAPRETGRVAAYSLLGLLGPIPNWVGMYNARDLMAYLAVAVATASQGVAVDEASRLTGDPVKSRSVRGVITAGTAAVTALASTPLSHEGIGAMRVTDLLFAGLAGSVALFGARRLEEAGNPLKAVKDSLPHSEFFRNTAALSFETSIDGRPAKVDIAFLDSPVGRALTQPSVDAGEPRLDLFTLPARPDVISMHAPREA